MAYGEWKNKDEKIVVFDLWGWTFDVTILEIWSEWTFQVLSTSGDTQLGWKDFDQKIINYLVDAFKTKEWINLKDNAMAMQRLKDEAEKAKMQLSQTEKVEIMIPFICTDDKWQPKNLAETLTRAQFENLCKDLLDRCKQPVIQALKDSKLDKNDINEVILVWWSTRMPAVKTIVKDIFGKNPKATVNPDEAVSQWAAIQWWIIQWNVTDILLLDVTPLSLAVEVEWGLAHVLIPRNTTIPAKKSNIYTTASDNQNAVTVHVVQWERQFAKDNKSLGQFNLEWIPPMRRGQPQIEVTFDIDANWILKVSAEEKSTWKKQDVVIQWATNLSDDEIEKAKEEAEKFAEEDKKRKDLVESKNKLEQLTYQMQNIVDENKDKLSDDAKDEVNKLIESAKEMKDKEDATKEDCEKELERLNKEFADWYQKHSAELQPSAWATDNQATPDAWNENNGDGAQPDEVIDAD